MNHFHQLLDDIERGSVGQLREISDETARVGRQIAAAHAKDAMCFSVGELADFTQIKVVKELCRLPYPTLWIEGTFSYLGYEYTQGIFVHTTSDATYEMLVFCRTRAGWGLMGAADHVEFESGNCQVLDPSDSVVWSIKSSIRAVRSFCSAINCANVNQVEHPPAAALQKARSRRGKRPLFSYWTLHVKGRTGESAPMGGTHDSPRVHLRRGHPREFAPGHWTWVQPHVVGNPKRGMVHKDYDVSRLVGKPQPGDAA